MNKISYALGLGIAQQLKSMGIEDFSVEDFSQSVSDILSGKTPAMTSREAQELLSEYFQKKQKEQAQKAIAEGRDFLEANAKREGVVQTKSGLRCCVIMKVASCQVRSSTAPMSAISLPSLGSIR